MSIHIGGTIFLAFNYSKSYIIYFNTIFNNTPSINDTIFLPLYLNIIYLFFISLFLSLPLPICEQTRNPHPCRSHPPPSPPTPLQTTNHNCLHHHHHHHCRDHMPKSNHTPPQNPTFQAQTQIFNLEQRVCLDRTYFAETENWKYCSKIIFKCVNNTVGPIFNEKIDKKWSLWDLWTVHKCTVHRKTGQTLRLKKKKRKLRKRRRNTLSAIQTSTKSNKHSLINNPPHPQQPTAWPTTISQPTIQPLPEPKSTLHNQHNWTTQTHTTIKTTNPNHRTTQT